MPTEKPTLPAAEAPSSAALIAHEAPRPSAFAMLINPDSLAELHKFCELLAKSDFVPEKFKGKPGDIMVAGAMGSRIGLDIFASMAGIAPINGRPTIWGDAMLAVCQASPVFQDFEETYTGTFPNDDFTARCTAIRKGRKPYTAEFSIADAKKAGLWTKQGPWAQYPKRQLQMRARGFSLRAVYADVLAGFSMREEEEDLRDVTADVTVLPDPKPAAVRTAPAVTEHTSAADPLGSVGAAPQAPAATASKPATTFTVEDLVIAAKGLAQRFGQPGMAAVKEFNDRLSIAKVSDCPADKVAEAFEILRSIEARLVERASEADGKGGGK